MHCTEIWCIIKAGGNMQDYAEGLEHFYSQYWELYDKACDSAKYCWDMRKEDDKEMMKAHLSKEEYETLMELRELVFPSHKCGEN
tara:strand:+ start:2762 stop:3016 length:255 start_codon:yes stop_codon:yes gene_type:complete